MINFLNLLYSPFGQTVKVLNSKLDRVSNVNDNSVEGGGCCAA